MLRQGTARLSRQHATAPPLPRLRPGHLPSTRNAFLLSRPPPSHATRRLYNHSTGPYQPLTPPSPSSLGAPRPPRTYPRLLRWSRRVLILAALLGSAYALDNHFYASGITRSARTFGMGLLVALDYKLNFRAEPLPLIGSEGGIPALHLRNAERVFELLRGNGGLYLYVCC